MIDDLRGKVVLVTGSSTGIGAAVAEAFGAEHARVVVHYHASRDAAEGVAARVRKLGGEAAVVRADLRDATQAARVVDETVATFGGLDVLINNAGDLVQRRPVADASDALIAEVIALNVMSVIAASRAAVPHFRRRGGGAIINTSSIAARIGGGIGGMLYGSSKAFVSNLTRGLAKELAADRVRVNAVSPGVIDTPFHARNSKPEVLEAVKSQIPLGRLGRADECAGAFLYLASERLSSYVTGQTIEVNGGQWMN